MFPFTPTTNDIVQRNLREQREEEQDGFLLPCPLAGTVTLGMQKGGEGAEPGDGRGRGS